MIMTMLSFESVIITFKGLNSNYNVRTYDINNVTRMERRPIKKHIFHFMLILSSEMIEDNVSIPFSHPLPAELRAEEWGGAGDEELEVYSSFRQR